MLIKKILKPLVISLLVTQIMFGSTVFATNAASEKEYVGQNQTLIFIEEDNVSKSIGDVNGDGSRDSIDLAFMRAVLLGKRSEFPVSNGIWASDVNGDGSFNSLDFAFMRKFLVGMIKEFPAESIETPSPTNTVEPTPTPTNDQSKANEFTKIMGGSNHTIALRNDGTVWSWGENYGKLGNNSEVDSCVPVEVNNLVDIKEISVGMNHSLALGKDGTVWAWGYNSSYQCGIKSSNRYITSPIQVKDIDDVKQIGAVLDKSYILKNDGSLWQCGLGSEVFSQVANIDNIKSISTFGTGYHVAALKNDSTVSLIEYYEKIVHVDGLKDVEKVICCPYYFLAIKNDGTVWSIETDGSYIQIPNINNVKEASGNYNDILILNDDGTLYVVKRNEISNYKKGVADEIQIENEFKNIISIGSGSDTSYIVKEDGTVWVFGQFNGSGEFGSGILVQNYPKKSEEKNNVENNDIVKSLYDYYWGEYILRSNGNVELVKKGYNDVEFDGISNVIDLVKGDRCFFALKEDGTVWSWGENYYGQLGDGTTSAKSYLVKVIDIENIVKISTGSNSVLALSEDGTVWSWGYNKYGQLGNGTNTNSYTPKIINSLSKVVDTVTIGGYSLALLEDGTVWSWGNNEYGQLGDGTNVSRNIPARIENLTDVVDIASLNRASFALKRDGTVWSWGENKNGVLGNNGYDNTNTPSKVVGLSNIIDIDATIYKPIFVDSNNQIWECGAPIWYYTPVRVTTKNDANLRYITINESFLESFDEDITEYNVTLPEGTTEAPNVEVRTYNPNATYTIVQPETVDGTAIIEVTAWDGETTKTYTIKFKRP